jgi:hypothetical protein
VLHHPSFCQRFDDFLRGLVQISRRVVGSAQIEETLRCPFQGPERISVKRLQPLSYSWSDEEEIDAVPATTSRASIVLWDRASGTSFALEVLERLIQAEGSIAALRNWIDGNDRLGPVRLHHWRCSVRDRH